VVVTQDVVFVRCSHLLDDPGLMILELSEHEGPVRTFGTPVVSPIESEAREERAGGFLPDEAIHPYVLEDIPERAVLL
jgi:hypothetical protein